MLGVCSGLLIAHCGEVCRHSEGQGAEAHGSAAAAADAAAQCCLHVGEPHRPQQPGATVSGSECVLLQHVQLACSNSTAPSACSLLSFSSTCSCCSSQPPRGTLSTTCTQFQVHTHSHTRLHTMSNMNYHAVMYN